MVAAHRRQRNLAAYQPFPRAKARWSELRTLDATRDAVRLVTADGREQRIRLRMSEHRDEVAAAVTEAARLRLPRGSH